MAQRDSKQEKIFDFKVCLFSSKTFRQELNEWKESHDQFMETIASTPSENCVLINKGKGPQEVVTDVTHGESSVLVADYGRVPPVLVVNNPGLDLALNSNDPPPPNPSVRK